MFVLSKKTANEYSYEGIINMRKVPLLPLDNRWHQLFPVAEKSAHIKKLEDEVMAIIKQESRISKELKDLGKLKKKLMSEIVQNMEETSDGKETLRQKKMETSQKLIREINDKIEKKEIEDIALPRKLLKANEELLYASIEACYERIDHNAQQIDVLSEWIERTRDELKKNVIIKQEKEEVNQNIYAYMHDMLGPEFMEIFDRRYKMNTDS